MLMYIVPVAANLIAQACCWWTCFNWCGCIDQEREIVRTEPPVSNIVIVNTVSNNPFSNPDVGIPKDSHLQSAYL